MAGYLFNPEIGSPSLRIASRRHPAIFCPAKDQKPGTPLSKEKPFIRLGLIDWSNRKNLICLKAFEGVQEKL